MLTIPILSGIVGSCMCMLIFICYYRANRPAYEYDERFLEPPVYSEFWEVAIIQQSVIKTDIRASKILYYMALIAYITLLCITLL
jgi:hypothetical protein